MRVPLEHHVRVVGEPNGAVLRHVAAVIVEHGLLPALVGLRPCLAQARDADRLQRRPRREFPLEIVARDKSAEPRMERADVIVLEVDFDEGFPVVIAIVDLDPVQHVARKIEVMNAE